MRTIYPQSKEQVRGLTRIDEITQPSLPFKRFTLDGDVVLEKRLHRICDWVSEGVSDCFSKSKLEAVVLGGGYGRGEGGVLRTDSGDMPYNDMEFYVYLRGNLLRNDFRYTKVLNKLAHELSAKAKIEIEFKLQSIERTKSSPVSMFSYDLVMGHRFILGSEALYEQCGHHRRADNIPSAELTRLLLNRCSGLLFSKQRLENPDFSDDDADFVIRNLAKLRLALGDVVLGIYGQYHWSCRQRARRLDRIPRDKCGDWLDDVRREHKKGMAFKLHPTTSTASSSELFNDYQTMSILSGKVWLWLEQLRLKRSFRDFDDYAFASENKCPESMPLRNILINLRQFGVPGVRSRSSLRYPRERLYRALPMLLWESNDTSGKERKELLCSQLSTTRHDKLSLVDAYEQLWLKFR